MDIKKKVSLSFGFGLGFGISLSFFTSCGRFRNKKPNNVGPEQVMEQMTKLNIPMKVFETKGEDIATAKQLVTEMGAYFHKEKQADSLNAKLDRDMANAVAAAETLETKPKVVVIHFGR